MFWFWPIHSLMSRLRFLPPTLADLKFWYSVLLSVVFVYTAHLVLKAQQNNAKRMSSWYQKQSGVSKMTYYRWAKQPLVAPRDPVGYMRLKSSYSLFSCMKRHIGFFITTRRRLRYRSRSRVKTRGAQERLRGKLVVCLENILRQHHEKTAPVKEYLEKPVQNPYEYNFIVNPKDQCAEKDIEVLFTVPSAPEFIFRRSSVRADERARFVNNPQNKAVLLFFLGLPSNDTDGSIQNHIDYEIARYGDIVQSDFVDTYRNILLKAMSMLKWAGEECGHAKMVIRTDDDVSINVSQAIGVMRTYMETEENFVLGRRILHDIPSSVPKWFLSKQDYPFTELPPYVRGGLIGYPMTTVQLLFQAALRLPSIWLDDVFITGICTGALGFPVYSNPSFNYRHNTTI